jgi:membrane fusion protein, multidrug efflux system
VIVSRIIESGQVVAPGESIFTIATDGEREAVFEAFLKDSSDHPLSDEIRLSLVSNPEVVTLGTIREIAPAIDASSGTVQVKVSVPDPPARMALGAPVVGVAQFHPVDVIALPWTALARTRNHPSVWIVDPSNLTVAEQIVDVEKHTSGMLFVTRGVKAGDIVVTAGSQMICPGQKVQPQSTNPEAKSQP